MNEDDVRALIAAEDRRRPGVAQLARHLSLAVRVDPALLRRVRVELLADVLPGSDAGLESDLWFSGLVESRGPAGFVLDADVADVLRKDLALDADRLERVVTVMRAVHPEPPESVRLEEEVAALALPREPGAHAVSADALAAIEEKLHTAVLALTDADTERAFDVARWALRALPRLPEPVRSSDAGILLALAASARLEGREIVPVSDRPGGLPQGAAWALANVAPDDPVKVGVRVRERAMEWVDAGDPAALQLEVPKTDPVYVELRWRQGSDEFRRGAAVVPGGRVELPEDADDLRIRTLAGREFVVEREMRDVARAVADDLLTSSCVRMGAAGVGFFVAPDRVLTRQAVIGSQVRREQIVTVEFKGRELVTQVSVSQDGFCLLRLPDPVGGARVLPLADQTSSSRWRALGARPDGAVEASGEITGVRRDGTLVLGGSRPDVALEGSPVVVGERVVGQVSQGEELTAVPAAAITDFLVEATRIVDARPAVFISAARDADEYAAAIDARLRYEGCLVLRDLDREVGADWDARLHEWLLACDAAVVLVSRDSIGAPFARKEATILNLRQTLNPELLLLPVQVGKVNADALGALGLEHLQALFARAPDEAADAVASAVVDRVGPHANRWLPALQRQMEALLARVPDEELAWWAEALDWRLSFDTVPAGLRRELATAMIGRIGAGPAQAIDVVRSLPPVLGSADSPLREALRSLTALWIDPVAAAETRRVIGGPAGQRVVALRAHSSELADMYLRRAWLEGRPPAVLMWGVSGDGEDPLGELRTQLVARLDPGRSALIDDKVLESLLSRMWPPLTVIVSAVRLDPQLLDEIQARFAHLGIFVLSEGEPLSGRITALPDPDPDDEERIVDAARLLEIELDRGTRGRWMRAEVLQSPAERNALLLERYAPLLRYDSSEAFFAGSPAMMTDYVTPDGEGNQLLRADSTVLASAAPTAGEPLLNLAFLGPGAYASGAPPEPSDVLHAVSKDLADDAAVMQAKPDYADRVYGHWVIGRDGDIWLQYWLFYYADDRTFLGFGGHQGDWEMVQILVGSDGLPKAAGLKAGANGRQRPWSDIELAGDTPVVYVARGSHATYDRPGRHRKGPWTDDVDGNGREVRPALELLGPETPWANWPGRWGSTDSDMAASPRGPALHRAWSDPDGWFVELTR